MSFPKLPFSFSRPSWLRLSSLTTKQRRIGLLLVIGVFIFIGVLNFSRCKKLAEGVITTITSEVTFETVDLPMSTNPNIFFPNNSVSVPTVKIATPVAIGNVSITTPVSTKIISAVSHPRVNTTSAVAAVSNPVTASSPLQRSVAYTKKTSSVVATIDPEPTGPLWKLYNILDAKKTTYQEIENWVNVDAKAYRCSQFWIEPYGRRYLKILPPNGQITMDIVIYATSCYAKLFDKTVLPQEELLVRLTSPPCRRDITVVRLGGVIYFERNSSGQLTSLRLK